MTTYFADVLALESSYLANVNTPAQLTLWRNRVVSELMNPHSPYSRVVRLTTATAERAHFSERWRALLAETVECLLRAPPKRDSLNAPSRDAATSGDEGTSARVADPDTTTLLILAALHGAATLSRGDVDPQGSINAVLDMALVAFCGDHNDTAPKAL